MTIIPVVIGLVLASLLFDYIRDQFGERLSSFFRAGFYLPQILPVTAAGVLWGWILSPVGIVNAILEDDRPRWPSRRTGSAMRPSHCLAVSLVIVWIQLGYCLVVFMAGLVARRSLALRGGRSSTAPAGGSAVLRSPSRCWRRRSSSSVLTTTIARAQGLRADLRADRRRAGQRDAWCRPT